MQKSASPNTLSLLLAGLVLVVLGVLAIATPAVAGKAVVTVIGVVLLLAGIAQLVSSLRLDGWRRKLPPLLLGVITSVCGVALLGEPWIGMEFIALILAAFFCIEGVWKIIASFNYRPASGWLAMLASGVLTLVLGVLIYRQWPLSGIWAIGILVGVDLLMTGVSMVAVAMTLRQLQRMRKDSAST